MDVEAVKDLEHVKRVEAELDAFVEKRARQAKEQQKVEDLWEKSAREHRQRREGERRREWCEYHTRLAEGHERTLRQLAEYHRREAARYAESVDNLPKGA